MIISSTNSANLLRSTKQDKKLLCYINLVFHNLKGTFGPQHHVVKYCAEDKMIH